MFRDYSNIIITREFIHIKMEGSSEEHIIVFDSLTPINWTTTKPLSYFGTKDEKININPPYLKITTKTRELSIYLHPMFAYNIEKSLAKCGMFDLNYRRHLRGQFSRKNMDIFFLDTIDDELKDDPKFNEFVTAIKLRAEAFSFGVESKPMVIIGPSYDSDHLVSYIILKHNKVVAQGVM